MPESSAVKINVSEIPQIELKLLGRTFLDAVKKFYENPENVRGFEEWKAKRDAERQQKEGKIE